MIHIKDQLVISEASSVFNMRSFNTVKVSYTFKLAGGPLDEGFTLEETQLILLTTLV
ncbi:MAG: hypothetical protein ACPG5Z_01910 [Pseudoalteromonas sp.]|mgnify:FL=1